MTTVFADESETLEFVLSFADVRDFEMTESDESMLDEI